MSVPINLSVPDELGPDLLRDAKRQKTSVQAVIVAILAKHYGVEVTLPSRGRPPKSDD